MSVWSWPVSSGRTPPVAWLPVRGLIALLSLVLGGLLAVSAGAARAALPAPSLANLAPRCAGAVWRFGVSEGGLCGPWSVPHDPANPFLGSFGQCVYWAIEKRPDIWVNRSARDGNAYDWDAWTWVQHARAEGLVVDGVPQPGDVVVWSRRQAVDSTGHVAYVEAVNLDRSITITEMNSYFGTRGGDWQIMSPTRFGAGLDGWGGLRFIHQPEYVTAPASTTFPQSPATALAAPAGTVPTIRLRALSLVRHGSRIRLTVHIAPRSGTVAVVAEQGRRRLHVHRSWGSSSAVLRFTAGLSPGRWTLTVSFRPAEGFTAPAPTRLALKIPGRARRAEHA